MKYSNYIGVVAAVMLMAVCFFPWVYIFSLQMEMSGMDTGRSNLGKPGLMNIIFSSISIILFLLQSVVAKRINVFVGVFNMSWAIRNYLLYTQCQMGECPEKKLGIYAMLFLSVIVFIMTLFPSIKMDKYIES